MAVEKTRKRVFKPKDIQTIGRTSFLESSRLQTVREEPVGLDDNIMAEINFDNLIEPYKTFQPMLMTTDQRKPERFNNNIVSNRFLL